MNVEAGEARMRKVPIALTILLAGTSPVLAAPQSEGQGTGPYPAILEEDSSLTNHVVYRPRDLSAMGRKKLPVYVWGNGGCSADGTSSRNHLLEIASHGFLAIAAGTIPKGPPRAVPAAPPPGAGQGAAPRPPAGPLTAATPTSALADAIDWAVRENARKGSPYQGRIATDRIAVSGWSCGGLQALNVASDPRVTTAVIMNSGFFNAGASPITGIANDKASLSKLHTPVLYVLGGPTDIAYENGTDDYRRIATVPAALVNIPVGHGGTYAQPNGGVAAEVVTAWIEWQLKHDKKAGERFKGAKCGYCADSRFTIERKRID
jgi:dienelactone hydrolase